MITNTDVDVVAEDKPVAIELDTDMQHEHNAAGQLTVNFW
jgi:hypothetical protein